jgi:hypothetical protein
VAVAGEHLPHTPGQDAQFPLFFTGEQSLYRVRDRGRDPAGRVQHAGARLAEQVPDALPPDLAFGSTMIGAITSGVILGHEEGSWPILVIWFAIVVINMAIFRVGPFRPDRRFPC